MKNLILIVNASVQQVVIDHLRELHITEFTLSKVEGHGSYSAGDAFISARDRVVGFVPRVRIDIVLEPERLTAVLEALREPDTGFAGHGIYWVSTIEHFDSF